MDCYSYNLEYIQNFVQLVWNEEGESSSVLRAISVVVDAEPDEDCTIDDENEIESEAKTVEKGEEYDFLYQVY